MDFPPNLHNDPTHYRGAELLNDHNYHIWANLSKTYLQSQRLYRPVILTGPPQQDNGVDEIIDWEAKNAEAKDYLLRSMSPRIVQLMRTLKLPVKFGDLWQPGFIAAMSAQGWTSVRNS